MTLTPSKVRKLPIQEPELLTYPELFHHQEDDTIDLLELLQTVWNWKWLILLLVVFGTLGSYGVTSILPKVYSASVLFLTEDENSLRRTAANPKLMHKMVQQEALAEIILAGFIQGNSLETELSPEEQAVGILLSGKTLSFEKEGFEGLNKSQKSSNNIFQKNIEIKELPKFSMLTVRHSDPESAQVLANRLPELMNQYSSKNSQDFYLKEREKSIKQISDIRMNQLVALNEIETILGTKGVLSISLMEGGNDFNIMTQLKLRLGEKLADMAISSTSADQQTFLKIQAEVKALEKIIQEQEKLMNLSESQGVKLKGKQQLYETLIKQESFLIEKKQKIEQTLSDLINRSLEMLSTASVPESPIEPKVRLIVALSAVVSLFAGIFLVFVIEFIKNARSRLKEQEAGFSPA
ncbi:MAG: Wzz/FepE/Etk N-terminal domain-containing protein [SAR324 cluster bacterium]|nr:Wzz/FepE/Etk N-terminal domain-containing protein [SAR324 cluster bacterium]